MMVDTSAWIEFLRGTGSPTHQLVVDALRDGPLSTCGPIRMEILAGARDAAHLRNLRGLIARASEVAMVPADYEHAAALYRTCRQHGGTVRKMVDCLIAAVAIRADVPVLHADSDFTILARHTALRVQHDLP